MLDLHSEKIPEVPKTANISDLFLYFGVNWQTLSPVLWLLFGTLFAFFMLTVIKTRFGE